MPEYLQFIVIAAIVGSGLVSGLLFAFSVAVMRALVQLPPAAGMFAMQRINALIINPLFLLAFLGTSALCLVVAVAGIRDSSGAGSHLLLIGAGAYLAGPLGITVAFNVPLNNRLALVTESRAAEEWPRYVIAWLRWNHLRTLLGVLATALLAVGLARGI